jgi:hypothetical protein
MTLQTKPCRNAAELANPMQVRAESGEMHEYTHTCLQAHTLDHEVFSLSPAGLCPFEDNCPHFEPKE